MLKGFDIVTERNGIAACFRSVHGPGLVLSSSSRSSYSRSLAIIHVGSRTEKMGLVMNTPHPEKTNELYRAQGVIEVPEESQEDLKFWVTNLSHSTLHINIFPCDADGTNTRKNPINEVNIVDGGSILGISCDQTTGRAMVLSHATEKRSDGTNSFIATEENETRAPCERLKGVYYKVMVLPAKTSELSGLFKNATWACTDLVVVPARAVPDTPNPPLYRREEEDHEYRPIYRKRVYRSTMQSLGFSERTNTSHVATLSEGERVSVNSSVVDIEIMYDEVPQPCVLGIGVLQKISPGPLPTDIQLKNEADELLNPTSNQKPDKIFPSEECCICLGKEPDLDTVFIPCGHQCVHGNCGNNLKDCPLCRCRIIAKYREGGNNHSKEEDDCYRAIKSVYEKYGIVCEPSTIVKDNYDRCYNRGAERFQKEKRAEKEIRAK
jgi:hypothetical protein